MNNVVLMAHSFIISRTGTNTLRVHCLIHKSSTQIVLNAVPDLIDINEHGVLVAGAYESSLVQVFNATSGDLIMSINLTANLKPQKVSVGSIVAIVQEKLLTVLWLNAPSLGRAHDVPIPSKVTAIDVRTNRESVILAFDCGFVCEYAVYAFKPVEILPIAIVDGPARAVASDNGSGAIVCTDTTLTLWGKANQKDDRVEEKCICALPVAPGVNAIVLDETSLWLVWPDGIAPIGHAQSHTRNAQQARQGGRPVARATENHLCS